MGEFLTRTRSGRKTFDHRSVPGTVTSWLSKTVAGSALMRVPVSKTRSTREINTDEKRTRVAADNMNLRASSFPVGDNDFAQPQVDNVS